MIHRCFDTFPPELCGHLWHTTHPDRYRNILAAGYILPNPPIPDKDRWKTDCGPSHYPYVRTIGGVSLFDFEDFEPESYSTDFPMSTWNKFVPYVRHWGVSVWIEMDREALSTNFLSGAEVLKRWKQEHAYGHTIMPKIEAACVGPIPTSSFRRVLIRGIEHPTFELLQSLAGGKQCLA